MTEIKDFLEIVYYIAFIILTWELVSFAKKTFLFETDKSYKLLCKVYVDESSVHKHGYRFGIEVFNYGQGIAENVILSLDGEKLTTIDFIKPNESYYFQVGTVGQMLDSNYIWLDILSEQIKPDSFKIDIEVQGQKINYRVSADLLYAYRSEVDGSLKDITKQIEKSSKDICDSIKKIK